MNRKVAGKKILIITDGNTDHSSSRIRILQYIPYLLKEGYQVKWIPRVPVRDKKKPLHKLIFAVKKRINGLRIIVSVLTGEYQILFIQRYFIKDWLLWFCKNRNKSIVYDFDDAIYISAFDNKADDRVKKIISNADLVITSCSVLKNYSRKINQNTVIITSAVDTNVIKPENREIHKVTIGWIGSEWTSKFLLVVEPVINELALKYDIRLMLVGANESFRFNCETEYIKWSHDRENEHLNSMDIGIMPLFDNEFERAKGGYKLFQYMAAGKPVMASPVGINNEIVVHGENGFLCSDNDDWIRYFSLLIENENTRQAFGKRGREMMLEKYSLDVCAVKLINEIKKL